MTQPSLLDKFLRDKVQEIKQSRERWQQEDWSDWHPVDVEPAMRERTVLYWDVPSQQNLALRPDDSAMTLEEARESVYQSLVEYFYDDTDDVLLFTADPGLGKSTAAIRFAQTVADDGYRTLYAMPRHDYWNDIEENHEYQLGRWYHWVSVDATNEIDEPMCRYAYQAKVWTGKGYPLIDVCRQLCLPDGHIRRCDYRQQARKKQPIIAGVHQHLVTGLAIKDFDLAIVDELPLGAFINERVIPTRFIDVGGTGRVADLFQRMQELAMSGVPYRGKRLLDAIGGILTDIYKDFDNNQEWVPVIPDLKTPDDVLTVKEWYLFDLLQLLIPEHLAWQNGHESWVSRVYIDGAGLHLLQRHAPWGELPGKLVIMDATGQPELYERLLGRPVRVLRPHVRRVGRIFHVAEKGYNISTFLKDATPNDVIRPLSKVGQEALGVLDFIRDSKPLGDGGYGKYDRIGVITYKAAAPYAEAIVGKGNVMWFGGSRGTNQFVSGEQPVDCVVVLGTPSPPDNIMNDTAAQMLFEPLDPGSSRIKPFSVLEAGTDIFPIRTAQDVEFGYVNNEGQAPFRRVTGFWDHAPLQLVLEMYRESEIRQAAHRGRTLTRECDVWILGSTPIPEEYDEVWHSADEALNIPPAVHYTRWGSLRNWIYNDREFIPVTEIAEREDVSKRWAAGWAKSIGEWSPDFEYANDPTATGRGRRPKGLLRT